MLRSPVSRMAALKSGLQIINRSVQKHTASVAEMAEAQPVFLEGIPLQVAPTTVKTNNETYISVLYDRGDKTLPCDTLLELNSTYDDAIPFLKFKRYTNDSPEEVLVGFDMNCNHVHKWLKEIVEHKLKDYCALQGSAIMHDKDKKFDQKEHERKIDVIDEKWRGVLIPPKEDSEQQMELAKFKVHPKANFYTEENELITKNEFKAQYVEGDEATSYSYLLIVEFRSLRYTKQKNLKVQAIVHGIKAVYTPNRQKEVEYADELPEKRVVFPDHTVEQPAKKQKTEE